MRARLQPYVVFCALLSVVAGGSAGVVHAASLLPLVTEEVETLPSGVAEAGVGLSYFRNLQFPAFTPPTLLDSQDLLAVPQLTFRVGAGDWAEIQATYELLYLNEEARNGQTNTQYGSGDARLYTKVRALHAGEVMPAIGFRFGAKLPNASRAERLGTDETDFAIDALFSRDFGLAAVHANLGLLLLGNGGPTVAGAPPDSGQDDLFTYSVAAVSAPFGQGGEGETTVRLLGEVAGREGSHFDNDRAALRVGTQIASGAATVYLGVSAGLVGDSEDVGVALGFLYSFEPAKLFSREAE